MRDIWDSDGADWRFAVFWYVMSCTYRRLAASFCRIKDGSVRFMRSYVHSRHMLEREILKRTVQNQDVKFPRRIPWSRVFVGKLIIPQLLKNFDACVEPEVLLLRPQEPASLSLPWAKSVQSTPFEPMTFRLILSSSSHLTSRSSLWPHQGCPPNLYAPLLAPYVLHAPPISFFVIWSPA